MQIVIVGFGIQGKKRKNILGKDFFASVDPYQKNSDFKDLKDIPLDKYDGIFLCVPEEDKLKFIKFCIKNKKHVLVEKPILSNNNLTLKLLEKLANKNNVILYSAYNHRFEPNFNKLLNLINSKKLGKIYSCRIFYGNGTAKLFKDSPWRDKGLGVISDLGSHLLDMYVFLFKNLITDFNLISFSNFENKSPDHAIIAGNYKGVKIQLEMSLCMWKNNFTCDILAEKGSAHIFSLCKWGPAEFIYRKRKFPSGVPIEKKSILIKNDPTWKLEYDFFKYLVKNKIKNNLDKDIWINNIFNKFKKKIKNAKY